MIIDLDRELYVLDERMQEHRVVSINVREKIVYCEDDTEYEYSTRPITVNIR